LRQITDCGGIAARGEHGGAIIRAVGDGRIIGGARAITPLAAQLADQRTHRQQQHQQHRDQCRAIAHQHREPRFFVEGGGFKIGRFKLARHHFHLIAALGTGAHGGADQRFKLGSGHRRGGFQGGIADRNRDRQFAQTAGARAGDSNLAPQFIAALGGGFSVGRAGIRNRGLWLRRAIDQLRIGRRNIGRNPRHPAHRRCAGAGRVAFAFIANHAFFFIGLARRGHFGLIEFDLHLRGKIAFAQQRQQKAIHLIAQLGFEFALEHQALALLLVQVGQQAASLIDHPHRIRAQPRNRSRDQIDDRFDLALRQAAPADEPRHHRCAGRIVFTYEHRSFGRCEVDAHAFDPVNLADGQHQLAFARQPQAFTLQRARGAKRHRVEHFACAFGRGDPGIAGNQHPRAVKIVFRYRQGTGGIVNIIADPARIERFDHLGAFAIGQP